MAYVVFHNIPHKQRGEVYTYHGINQIQQVEVVLVESLGEQQLYLFDNPVQYEGSDGGKKAHEEAEDKRKLLVGEMRLAPYDKPLL